jgi:hypothetical protein
MDYYNKYLKYKNKYLYLKDQRNSLKYSSNLSKIHGGQPDKVTLADSKIYLSNQKIFKKASISELSANAKERLEEEVYLFINAWNEWAEGNHLEPCQKWGNEYLKVIQKTVKKYNNEI